MQAKKILNDNIDDIDGTEDLRLVLYKQAQSATKREKEKGIPELQTCFLAESGLI